MSPEEIASLRFAHEWRREAVASNQEYPGLSTNNGLFQGKQFLHFAPEDSANMETVGRTICNVALLVSVYDDGAVDATLAHFFPLPTSTRALRTVIRAATIGRRSHEPSGQKMAVLLTSNPFYAQQTNIANPNYPAEIQQATDTVIDAMKDFLGGADPIIISVDPQNVTARKKSELILTKRWRDGNSITRISETLTRFHREFVVDKSAN